MITIRQRILNNRGILGVLAVIAVVISICFSGWLMLQRDKQTDTVTEQTLGPDTQTPTVPVSDSAIPPPPARQ